MIGELARMLEDSAQRLLASRSPDDLVEMAAENQALARALASRRPLLGHALAGDRPALGAALDAERRGLMEADVARLASYRAAAADRALGSAWSPAGDRRAPLAAQHEQLVERALGALPFGPGEART